MRPDTVFEIKEMVEYRHLKSKEMHKDLGEEAYIEWAQTRAERFRRSYETHKSQIEKICREHCPEGCKGLDKCPLDIDCIHTLLKDRF